MFIFIGLLCLSIVGFAIHLWRDQEPRTYARVIDLLLLYQLVFSVGATSLLAFFALSLMPGYIAAYTGWPECPFEQQLANVNLGYAVLGFLCIWLRDHFWTATVLGFSIWIFSDGIAHLSDAVRHNNYADGNVGVPLYTDIIVPAILVVLLILRLRTRNVA